MPMSEAERHAAAMADPDARPMTDAEWARAPRVPQVSIIRRALKLSQEQFATTFDIPIGTIRDWEQGRYEPDAAARAYLRVIARETDTVRKALAAPASLPGPGRLPRARAGQDRTQRADAGGCQGGDRPWHPRQALEIRRRELRPPRPRGQPCSGRVNPSPA